MVTAPSPHACRSQGGGARFGAPGFTLVELLVCLGLIGLLIALSLPAVTNAREAARRVQCLSHLRQIGLAIHSYDARFQVFPLADGHASYSRVPSLVPTYRGYSIFCSILPDLEAPALHDAINFGLVFRDRFLARSDPELWPGIDANRTVASTRLSLLCCPSDTPPGDGAPGVSYRASLGTQRWPTSVDGPFSRNLRELPAAAVTDGLGNTAAVSEKCMGGLDSIAPHPESDFLIVPSLGRRYSLDDCEAICATAAADSKPAFTGKVGLCWLSAGLGQTCYNHTRTPNSPRMDCGALSIIPPVGLFPAASRHEGGVNVLMMDGSTRFVKSSISLATWMSLGTRAGGEIVTGPD